MGFVLLILGKEALVAIWLPLFFTLINSNFINKIFIFLPDISPSNSAAIPDREDSSDSVNENDDTNPENYSTTEATDDDIGKIFETYENLYIKNSNWYNDDELASKLKENVTVNEDIKSDDEESTPRDFETTEPTADYVVDAIHNIMDETIDSKKNRTDRTIVVVVTTNVFNINGSDDSSKRQHTLLSFGTPGMISKETSTDATLAMHNKITTEFFNSNLSPVNEQPGTIPTNDTETSNRKDSETIGLDDSGIILPVTEEEKIIDDSTTETPSEQDDNLQEIYSNMDIRQLHDSAGIQSAHLESTHAERRNFDETSSNDDSNDILRIMKVLPNRSEDETAILSNPYEIPEVQEPPDTSLMEAIENILDTDVRKAFERDIPQTRHVPLDINIEEEALYAPLKDMSEYIVEEVPINENFEIFKDNYETDTVRDAVNNVDPVEQWVKVQDFNYKQSSDIKQREIDNPINEPATESLNPVDELPATTTQEATTTTERVTKIETKDAREDEPNAANQQVDDIDEPTEGNFLVFFLERSHNTNVNFEFPDSTTTTTTSDDLYGGSSYERSNVQDENHVQPLNAENAFEAPGKEIPERVEILQRSETMEKSDLVEVLGSEDGKTVTKTETQPEVSGLLKTTNDTDSDNESTLASEQQEKFAPDEPTLSIESDRQLRHTSDDEFEKLLDQPLYQLPMYVNRDTTTASPIPTTDVPVETFEKLVDRSFNQYPIYVFPDATAASPIPTIDAKDFVNFSNTFVDATMSNDELAAILDVEEKLDRSIKEAELVETDADTDTNLIEEIRSTTTNSDEEDVVSEVVKVDEATTEQHQIIKKPGVNDTSIDDVEINPIKGISVASNDLLAAAATIFESRSFSDNDEQVDPLRILVEGVELTADLTKAVDNFQSLMDANDALHYAANQIVESKDDMAVVTNTGELNSDDDDDGSLWGASARYVYIAVGALSIGLIVLLGVVSVLRFRQFKRNILFSC